MLIGLRTSGAPSRRIAGSGRARLREGRWSILLDDDSTVADALDALGLSAAPPMLVILGDRRLDVTEFASTALNDGDSLALMPAIRAG